jgi:hypothetical protein
MKRLRLSWGAWQRLSAKIKRPGRRGSWHTKLGYALNGVGHSLLLRLQESSHASDLKTTQADTTIFVLGFWRSGTTLLHELLCCDSRFGFPSTYACLNPSHFLLTEKFASGKTKQAIRPMDRMAYSWASPQEDEFALLCMGAPSPYEALVVPSLMRDPAGLVDLGRRTTEEQASWQDTLRRFLRLLKIQQGGKTLILKSPPHGFKLSLLLSMFPDARFLLIERNPYEVFASNLNLWHKLLDWYAVESTVEDEIENFILEAYVLHEEAIAKRADSVVRVHYEELVADPVEQMAKLYQELRLEHFDEMRPALETYMGRVARHERNRFSLTSTQKARIDDRWGALLSAKGYSWPGDYLSLRS